MIFWILFTVAEVAADFVTKMIVQNGFSIGQTKDFIPGFIEFLYIRNEGAAWGMLSDNRWVFLVLTAVALIVLPILLYKFGRRHFLLGLSLSMLLGGAAGNMIDRVFYGSVVDFLHFQMKNFPLLNETFPVFNVADCFVTLGAVLLVVCVILYDDAFARDGKKLKDKNTETDAEENENDKS